MKKLILYLFASFFVVRGYYSEVDFAGMVNLHYFEKALYADSLGQVKRFVYKEDLIEVDISKVSGLLWIKDIEKIDIREEK